MKSWIIFTQNAILIYWSFLFIESLTFPRLSFHFLSDWPPYSNLEKRENAKSFPISNFLVTLYFILEILLHFYFLIIWKDLRELLLVLVIFALQQKKSISIFSIKKKKKQKKKKKKRYNLMIESLLSNNTSNLYKFIMTPTRG